MVTSNPHQRSILGTRLARWATALVAVGAPIAGGCQGPRPTPSEWPPADFHVEVEACEVVERRTEVRQRIVITAEGVVVYLESRGTLEGAPLPIAVFSTAAMYQLDPRSLRTLSRLLAQEGLFEADGERSTNASDLGRQVTVTWTADGESGRLSTLSLEVGPLERVVRVLEAFLPEGRRIEWPGDLTQPPVPRRVEETPEPIDFLPGAVFVLERLARQDPDDRQALLELFAVAVEAGSFAIAEDALRTYANLGTEWGGDATTGREAKQNRVTALDALLTDRRAAGRSSLRRGPAGS